MQIEESENQFSVKWTNHHGNLISVLEALFNDETYVDCTLAAEGNEISAHKVVLSACSPFLAKMLKKHYDKHPIILLRDVSYFDLQAVIEYMYKGEVNLTHDKLASFLKVAELLQVSGLSGMTTVTSAVANSGDSQLATDKMTDDESEPGSLDIKMPRLHDKDIQDEGVEYLSEEDTVDDTSMPMEQIRIKNEYGNYQVYLVDNESGGLKELEAMDDGDETEGDVTVEVMEDLLSEDSFMAVKPDIKGRVMPEKIQTASNRPKIKPRAVIQRDEYSINCEQCGGLYKHQSSFFNHLRHDCNQVHKCGNCQKSFKNKRHLLDHVRDDCGKVHMCPRCHKYFKQKVNLTTHMKHYCKPDKMGSSPTRQVAVL